MSVDPACTRAGFAFPGMGVGTGGAEARLFARHRAVVDPFLRTASEWVGADLEAAIPTGGPRGARERELFTYAVSCALAAVARAGGLAPRATAGLSLGLYAALWAAGAFSFEAGLALVAEARAVMDERLAGEEPAGMGAVVGLDRPRLEQLLDERRPETVRLANVLSPLAHVFSGTRREVEGFLTDAKGAGALRTVLLDVDTPFHSPLLLGGIDEAFRARVTSVPWTRPGCPVISSIDGTAVGDVTALQDLTVRNLSTPIRWDSVLAAFTRLEVEVVIECGPGTSLSQNAVFVEGAPPHRHARALGPRAGG